MDLIYCVEDDEGIRDLITYAVKSAGFVAEGFESASDFEKRLGERLPSMVLLDIMLPDKDGIAILKDIRNNVCQNKFGQNHNYIVADLPDTVEETFVNVNDGTCEGIRHKTLPIQSVQFHPEASPGPLDTDWLFDRFLKGVN